MPLGEIPSKGSSPTAASNHQAVGLSPFIAVVGHQKDSEPSAPAAKLKRLSANAQCPYVRRLTHALAGLGCLHLAPFRSGGSSTGMVRLIHAMLSCTTLKWASPSMSCLANLTRSERCSKAIIQSLSSAGHPFDRAHSAVFGPVHRSSAQVP